MIQHYGVVCSGVVDPCEQELVIFYWKFTKKIVNVIAVVYVSS